MNWHAVYVWSVAFACVIAAAGLTGLVIAAVGNDPAPVPRSAYWHRQANFWKDHALKFEGVAKHEGNLLDHALTGWRRCLRATP